MSRSRRPAVLTLLGIGLFWAGVVAAGTLVEGYSHRGDYISSLAGRGSPVAGLGVLALLGSALAHAAASRAVRGAAPGARLASALLLASGAAIVVIAVFPDSCPAGPAGCGVTDDSPGDSPGDWIGTVHVAGVVAYELVAVAAMVMVAVAALRVGAAFPRWLGPTSLVLAAASVVLLSSLGGDDTGLWQRLWVALHHLWLLVVVGLPGLGGQRPGARGAPRTALRARRTGRRVSDR